MAAAKHKPFVHLHQHTDYSLLDGCCRVDALTKRAAELEMPAIAITDHGNLLGVPAFYKAAKKNGIKPIIGCEIYLVHDHMQNERPKRERKRSDDIDDIPEDELGPEQFPKNQIHHKTILAKNFKGYQNLVKLVSDAHLNGQYYRPRTDMEKLAQYSEGLIGLSGCINGVASQYLIYNNWEKAVEVTAQFIDIFGKENYFIEVQNHGMPVQKRIAPGLLKLADHFKLPAVAANDVHYVYEDHWQPHDALLCIQTGKRISDEKRMRYPCHEFYLKSYAEMLERFPGREDILDNTVQVAELCDIELPFGANHYPKFTDAVELSPAAAQLAAAKKAPESVAQHVVRLLDLFDAEQKKVQEREGQQHTPLSESLRSELQHNGEALIKLAKEGLLERYGICYDSVRAAGKAEGYAVPSAENPYDAPERFDPADELTYQRAVCDKMDYELALIAGLGFTDYFLIVWDFIRWARERSIPVGPGRGSGAGCLVAYVLKITDIEPMRFGLLFERMLNLERVSPPDFDVDFCMRRRDEVVNYVREKYGADRVANIITYGTFGAKMVVRDLARVKDVPYADADRMAKMIPDDLNISLEAAVEKSTELREETERNPIARDIIKQGKVIEGMVRSTGKHACGIIIGDRELTDLVPLTLQEGDLTTQYDKGPVEDLGMLKMDFLGLKTLTVIADAQENIRRAAKAQTGGSGTPNPLEHFDVEAAGLDDAKTYELLNTGHTTCVFQLESSGMQALCRQIGLSTFEEIIALIALYRPGPMQFIPQFIEGKQNPESVQVPHPLIEDLVRETYGVLVYQEQVMQAAQIIAGYTLGGADILRRAMGKKIKAVMDAQKEIFITGAKQTNDINRKVAEGIFSLLEKFAQYGFNKSHSAAYAMLSYRTAYLKANFPVEFMSAVLSSELGNSDKLAHFIDECGAMGIDVLQPDINQARINFTPVVGQEKQTIRFGLGAVKGVGDAAARAIVAERETSGPFTGFTDFVLRTAGKGINRRVLEHLAMTGAFDAFGVDRGHLLQNTDRVLAEAQSQAKDREAGQANLFDMLGGGNEGADDGGNANFKIELDTSGTPMEELERLGHEKALLGFYVTGHPLNRYAGLAETLSSFESAHDELFDGAVFRVCAVVSAVQKRITQRDKRAWAIVNLQTRTHSLEVNCYSDAYEQFGHKLEPGALLCLHGQAKDRNGDLVLNIHDIVSMEVAVSTLLKSAEFILNPNAPEAPSFLPALAEFAHAHEGETRLRVSFQLEGGKKLSGTANDALSAHFTRRTYQQLREHPAVLAVNIHAANIPQPPKRTWG